MIFNNKRIISAHFKALYWKKRMIAAEKYYRRYISILAECGSGKHETEYGEFTVSANNSYPAEEIQAKLTDEQIAQCMELRWSQERARILFPAVYLSVKKENGYKVSIGE